MVVNTTKPDAKKTPAREPGQIATPILVASGAAMLLFLLFMYHLFVSPLFPQGHRQMERVAPPPGYPDVPPYNTKVWQENARPGQRMPGVPPVDYSRQTGPH